jgi:predicted peptidase
MTTFTTAVLIAMHLIANPTDPLSVEPGKQLPQSITIHVQSEADARDITIPYLLFVPRQYQADGPPMPLMLFLHGLGECGDGSNLDLVKTHGPPKLVDSRPDFPFVVASPQCPPPQGAMKDVPNAWKADQLIQLIDHVAANLNVDQRRIYVTGLSMGGFGAWRLAATYPERIAAALPICGGGEPREMAVQLARVPIWAFHGARDQAVPLARSQEMVNAVCRRGGHVRFTIYPEAEHDSWTETYNNEKIYDWLLSHQGPL